VLFRSTIPVLADTLVEGTETLQLSLTAVSNAAVGDQPTTIVNILDVEAGQKLLGTPNNDVIKGNSGDDIIKGRGSDDRLVGKDGDDKLAGQGGDDRLKGGNGDDILRGGGGDDRLIGKNDDDLLRGGGGDDLLKGGNGDDKLIGGRGDDKLIGGDGSDIFVLKQGHGTDFIRDFDLTDDQIQLRGSLSFDDLAFSQQGNKALISANGEDLALLKGVQASELTSGVFI